MSAGDLVVRGGFVVTPDGPRRADVVVRDGRIAAIVDPERVGTADSATRDPAANDLPSVDASGGWVAPGFIDLQINGAAGVDLTSTPERVDEVAAALPRTGVTAFLPTIVSSPRSVRDAARRAVRGVRPDALAAVPLGLHLEGPVLSPERHGAHDPAVLVTGDAVHDEAWTPDGGVRMVTLAPEVPGAIDLVRRLASDGVVVAAGHTACDVGTFRRARDAGLAYVTHLFNAMAPFAHRAPGPVGATLADDGVVAGMICDGLHVDPVAVAVAWRALGPHRTSLVTDAMAGALGHHDDTTRLGGVEVRVGPDGARTAEGTLAGSVLSLDAAVRNLVAFTGCPVVDAIRTVTQTPATLLGLRDRGRVEVGARADLVVLDRGLGVARTIIAGRVAFAAASQPGAQPGGPSWRS